MFADEHYAQHAVKARRRSEQSGTPISKLPPSLPVCGAICLIPLWLHFEANDVKQIRPCACLVEVHPIEEDDKPAMSTGGRVVDFVAAQEREDPFAVLGV